MRRLFAASLLALSGTLVHPAIAADEERAVPIVMAPYHRPVFTNDYITLLNVYVPPGRNTGYHIHSSDSVSVNISPADMTNQNYGSNEVTRGQRAEASGRATFANYVKEGTRAHKATNVGPTPFHNVSFIMNSPTPWHFTPSTRNVAGYSQIMDNERVRGWRIALEPGQTAEAITQGAPGIRIVVHGGEIAEMVPGQADRGWFLDDGEFFWQDAGTTRALKNIGNSRVEIVEFELK